MNRPPSEFPWFLTGAILCGLLVAWGLGQERAGEEAVRGLLPGLRSPEAAVRVSTVEALGEIGSLLAVKAMLTAVEDPDDSVRAAVDRCTARTRNREALDWLAQRGVVFPNVRIRDVSARALGAARDPVFEPALLGALADSEAQVRRTAADGLSGYVGPSVLPALTACAGSDKDIDVRLSALAAIGRRGDAAATVATAGMDFAPTQFDLIALQEEILGRSEIRALLTIEGLEDPRAVVRRTTARFLRGREDAAPALVMTRKREKDPAVRQEVLSVLPPEDLLGCWSDLAVEERLVAAVRLCRTASAATAVGLADRLAAEDDFRLQGILEWGLLRALAGAEMPDWWGEWAVGHPTLAAPIRERLTPSPPRAREGILADRPMQLHPAFPAVATEGAAHAVEDAWGWLLARQEADGRWRCATENPFHANIALPGFDHEDEWVDPAATALAILCFLHAGETPVRAPFRRALGKGLEFLRSCQEPDGLINRIPGHRQGEACELGDVVARYNHSLATLALAETYAMTREDALRDPLERALEHARQRRDEVFGWSFYLEPTDIGPSFYYIMALCVARGAGVEIGERAWVEVRTYLDKLTRADDGRVFVLVGPPYCFGGFDSTATGIVCRRAARSPAPAGAERRAVAFLTAHPPVWVTRYRRPGRLQEIALLERDIANHWYWYFGALALSGSEDGAAVAWNDELRSLLLDHQRGWGVDEGSWDPVGPWAAVGGRLYSTTFSILTLLADDAYVLPAARKEGR